MLQARRELTPAFCASTAPATSTAGFYDIGPNDSSNQMQQSPEERPEIAGAKHVEQEQAH
jgi:hypothetical protein